LDEASEHVDSPSFSIQNGMIDINCDVKIKPNTILGKILYPILKGPIEGNEFHVDLELDMSKISDEPIKILIEIHDQETNVLYGDLYGELVEKLKFRKIRKIRPQSPGRKEVRIYFDTHISLNIYDNDGAFTTYSESATGYHVVKQGTRYYMEYLQVHSFLEVIMIFFAVISGIGAIFEILNFFFKR